MIDIEYMAWDKLQEKMVKVNRIDFDKKEIDVIIEKTDSTEKFYSCSFDEIELLEYIGIKDIHQNKVFQGHIVKVKEIVYTNCYREEIDEIREYTGEVVWHQYGWHIAEKIEHGIRYHSLWLWNIKDDETDPDTHFMEIIGSRWDNPEMKVIE